MSDTETNQEPATNQEPILKVCVCNHFHTEEECKKAEQKALERGTKAFELIKEDARQRR